MAGKSAILSIKILTDASKAKAGMADAEKSVGGFGSKLQKGSVVAAGALAAVGVAAVGAAKAAAEDQQAQAVLANTLHKAAGATDAQVAATEDWISKTAAATGVADDQLRPALANLVRATGDVTKSQDAMGVALDVAAATGQDVEAVTKALAKGYGGNTKALGKLVPGMDKAVLASGDMNKVMAELQRTTGGAAAVAADTAAGKMARFQLAMDEAKESAGAVLLPALSALSGVLLTVGGMAQKHSTAFVALAVAIGLIAGAVIAVNAAMKVYQATLVVVNAIQKATWLSNPIFLIIAAIILLVAAVVLLWKKSETFRSVVLGVWGAIRVAAIAVANVIRTVWNLVFAVLRAYVMAYVAVFRAAFNIIRSVVGTVTGWVKAAWAAVWAILKAGATGTKIVITAAFNAIRGPISAVTSWVQRTWGSMVSAVKRAMSGLASVLSAPFDAAKRAIDLVVNAVSSLVGWLGRIRVPHISWPKPPSWLAGIVGQAAAPTVATTGVGGGFRAAAMPTARTTTATTGGIVINVSGAIDPEATARQIRRILAAHNGRMGRGGVLHPVGTV